MQSFWRITTAVGVLGMLGVIAGCTHPETGLPPNAGAVHNGAPAVNEMEVSGDSVAPPNLNGKHNGNGASHMQAPPKVEKHPSPIVDEAATLPSRDLHGYDSPRLADVQPRRLDEANGVAMHSAKAPADPLAADAAGAPPLDAGARSGADPRHSDYRIEAGDLLEFMSFNDPALTREVTVRYDGYVSLPLIRDVRVGNATRQEAEERIREEYRNVFRDPQFSLIIRESLSKTFTVVGDIATPGNYPYTGDLTLLEAISQAGGLRDRNTTSSVGGFVGITGQLTKAMIARHVNGRREVLTYDLRGLSTPGPHDGDAPVYPGDLVYVPEGVNLVYVLGESRNPVIVEITEGMTLLQLLALSGGFNASTARLRGVFLIREIEEGTSKVYKLNVRKMLKTGEDVPMRAGDIVYIPRKHLVRIEEFVRLFAGSITPVVDLYQRAVNAYYAERIFLNTLEDNNNLTLQTLDALGRFGDSAQDLSTVIGNL